VAERDPASIQQEIEQTRAELAAAVDAIADRVSPRRAAARGANRVKSVVGAVRPGSVNGHAPLHELSAAPGQPPLPGEPAGARRLRTGRVLIAAGAVGALGVAAALLIWLRRR
jgi:hypothetical protein